MSGPTGVTPRRASRGDAVSVLVATLFGLGRWPWAPATLSSAVVSLAVFLLGPPGPGALLIAGLVVALGGVFVADRAESVLGRDASEITVDEVAGMLLALSTAPATPVGFLCAFLLFRIFDILKPPPVGALERLKGGLGVVADDLAAGCYAALVLVLPRLLGLRLPWLHGTS